MSRTVLYPYKMGSQSGRDLARSLNITRIYSNRRYRYRPSDRIINWGSGELPEGVPLGANIINHPYNVRVAGHKLHAYQAMSNIVRVPPFTTSIEDAEAWQREDHTLLARTLMRAHSGRGITIVEPGDTVPPATLYVRYVKKRDEYRVHIVNGNVVDYVRKMVRAGSEDNNFKIRNHVNGWVFGRDGVDLPEDVVHQSLLAIEALGLDFGAVDVGFNTNSQEATVYEVNTAPGLVGTTLETYTEALNN